MKDSQIEVSSIPLWKKIACWLITACLVNQSTSALTIPSPEKQKANFIEYLKEEQDRLKTLFDQEALLEELNYDADEIIDFVSNKIVYQAYDGVLRGAKGTLIGRAGNSHDQAITLAGMLNDAGLEAEILVGKLTAEQATELNLTIASPKFSELKNTISSSKSIIAKKIAEKVDKLVKTEGESISSIMKETDALAERIFQQLPEEEINKGIEAFKASVQSSAISYRWVRYRLAQGKKWIEVHPAYVGAKKWNLSPEFSEKSSVNADDLQQFSAEVWIENSAGEKHSITGLWKKPAANLLDHTLSIEIASDAMMKPDLLNKPEEMLKQSYFFFVKIDGNLSKEGKAFDLNGNVYSGNSLSGLNTVFSTLNKQTQKAADALDSLSFSNKAKFKSKKQLTKVWLEFTLDKPNAKSRNIKRVIFDENALKDTSKTSMRLLQRWDIDIATTTPMQQYYQNNKSEQVVEILNGAVKFQEYIKNTPNAKQEEIIDKYRLSMGNPNKGLLVYKRSVFDSYDSKKTNISYLNEPYILAVRHGLKLFKTGLNLYETTDIISNKRWSFKQIDSKISPSLKDGLKRGIWETRTESESNIHQNNSLNRESAFNKLTQTKKYFSKEYNKLLDYNLYEKTNSAWWNIDLETGSTVGMIESEIGTSGGVTEYLPLLAFAFSFALFNYGIYQCMSGSVSSFACCMLVNVGLFVGSVVLGYALATYTLMKKLGSSTVSVLIDINGLGISNLTCK